MVFVVLGDDVEDETGDASVVIIVGLVLACSDNGNGLVVLLALLASEDNDAFEAFNAVFDAAAAAAALAKLACTDGGSEGCDFTGEVVDLLPFSLNSESTEDKTDSEFITCAKGERLVNGEVGMSFSSIPLFCLICAAIAANATVDTLLGDANG